VTTGTQTGTGTAIAKSSTSPQDLTLSLFRPGPPTRETWNLMNALMSILVNTLTLEVVIDCFVFHFLSLLSLLGPGTLRP
jgi:hypothetical protein